MKQDPKVYLKQMSDLITEMVELVYKGLMENDIHYLNRALNKERVVDDLEREITKKVIRISRNLDKKAQKELVLLEQTAQNIERMGDELRSLMERIEIKIAEQLFFSEIGIEQYKEVFETMHKSVSLTVQFLDEGKRNLLNMILRNGEQVKKLIEKYRIEHVERLTKGICQARAANMYFGMLDFTGNIARHCTNIAKAYKGHR